MFSQLRCLSWGRFLIVAGVFGRSDSAIERDEADGGGFGTHDLAARGTRQGFDIGRGTISHIETGLRGVSDLEMVLLAKALRVKLDELVPADLPAWRKDLRPPTARAGE